jgi:carboxyl-terminal processing protease
MLLARLALCGWLALGGCGPTTWTGGVHAQLAWSERGVRVVEVPPDSPAQRGGLRAGDRVMSVDDQSIAGLTAEQVQRLLAGEVGSIARLQVLREGETRTLAIEREPYAAKGARQ